MVKPEILEKFTSLLGPQRVKTSKEDLLTYSYDAFIAEYAPEAVIFPKTTPEVAEIMKIASANRVFVTPRGSGSGLSAAALGQRGGCHDLFHHDEPDPGDQYRQPVRGGRAGRDHLGISEGTGQVQSLLPAGSRERDRGDDGGSGDDERRRNAGGEIRGHAGLPLLGLEIVLPSGAVMNTGGVNAKDVTGYDLTRLLCGSEGTLALATKIIVRLLPKPKTKRTLQAIYNRIDDAGNTVAKIIEAGIIPATLELMDNQIVKALEDFMHLGFPLDAEAVLLIDVDGEPETVEKQAVLIAEFSRKPGGPGCSGFPVRKRK